MQRLNSTSYPWYDSVWLHQYMAAKDLIAERHPDKLAAFVDTFACLRTSPQFQQREVAQVFDAATLARIRDTISSLPMTSLELHEAGSFRRFVVHDHEYFTQLQRTTEGLVGELAGEPVDSGYNFLSLYSATGVCPIHMDSPQSKWTLDICIDQSEEWPIYFSQVVPWPETHDYGQDDYDRRIKSEPGLRFKRHTLKPGSALLFSGSSQWHYRDAMPGDGVSGFCTLLFFHFVPKGMRELIEPKNWAAHFGIPELAEAIRYDSAA